MAKTNPMRRVRPHSAANRIRSKRTMGYSLHICGVVLVAVSIGIYVQYFKQFERFDNPLLQTPRTYEPEQLHTWESPPVVPENPDFPGEMGEAFILPEALKTLEEIRYREHEFNILVSEALHINRSLPDYRTEECRKVVYADKLPNTSIIIIFHNEAWSTLIRTIWSVINRSPRSLVHEIILVDDDSEFEYLGDELDAYVAKLPIPCFVLRQQPRAGLIQARMLGAEQATGQTLTFLDAHCECTEGWLEPLLERIAINRYAVPSPTIDIIEEASFKYHAVSFKMFGILDKEFKFNWVDVPDREWRRVGPAKTTPLRMPAMAGGLFTIDREFFYEIGAFDEGMQIWGGENVEISLRIWLCGGELEFLACSRVGHVFRKNTPYKFPRGPSDTIMYNSLRMAKVWLDGEHFDYFMKYNEITKNILNDYGDLTERLEIRDRLQCKNFQWYVDNVYPEFYHQTVLHLGQIIHAESEQCLDVWNLHGPVKMSKCHNAGGNQKFEITIKSVVIKGGDYCLEASPGNTGPLRTAKCDDKKTSRQLLMYSKKAKTISIDDKYCLTRVGAVIHPIVDEPVLMPCDGTVSQQWLTSE